MTAQVAVLTVNGVALASDSAVTIVGSQRSRSYQSADKIFPIDGMPLAVLHSGNATIAGVPWQLLLEMWSQSRTEEQAASMEEYANEFAAWLAAQESIAGDTAQDAFFRWTYRDYMLAIRQAIWNKLEAAGIQPGAGYLDPSDAALVNDVVDRYLGMLRAREDFHGMSDVDAKAHCERISEGLATDFEWVFDDTPKTPYLDEHALTFAHLLVTKAEPFTTDAVLAFAGYGQDDYFPSLYQLTVSGVVAGRMRYYDDSRAEVNADSKVTITPLGITDAMQSFLRGTSPQYKHAAHEVLDEMFQAMEPAAEANGEEVTQKAHERLEEKFQEIEWDQYLSPTLNIVETLPLSEMLRLADSLVGLSSLRQLISGESSVGGPVDLARITKQSGFEWVRSKRSITAAAYAQ